MKTIIITCALALCVLATEAQTGQKKTRTVRIKKIENINGVEKVSDTTFTTNDPAGISLGEEAINIQELKDKDGKVKQIVILKDHDLPQIILDGGGGQDETLTFSSKKNGETRVFKKVTVQDSVGISYVPDISSFEVLENEAGNDDPMIGKTVIIKRPAAGCGATREEIEAAPVLYQVTIVRKIKLAEPSEADKSLLGKPARQLGVENLNLYPNPGNGKFNLSFKTEGKGEAEVSVLDIQGNVIYEEKVQNEAGVYSKQLDLSENPKGVYFLRIRQANSEALKKLILE